jgi:hypothetical protein
MDDNLSMERMKTFAWLTGDHDQLCPSVREISMLHRATRRDRQEADIETVSYQVLCNR